MAVAMEEKMAPKKKRIKKWNALHMHGAPHYDVISRTITTIVILILTE